MEKPPIGTTKRCCYGLCKSDTRSKNFKLLNYYFIAFPKPCLEFHKGNLKEPTKKHYKICKKCQVKTKSDKWVRLCGRSDRGFRCIRNITKDTYICSLHFPGESGPTEEYPDPVPVMNRTLPKRSPARIRTSLDEKYRKITPYVLLQEEDTAMEISKIPSEITPSGSHCTETRIQDNGYVDSLNVERKINFERIASAGEVPNNSCIKSLFEGLSMTNEETSHYNEVETKQDESPVEIFDENIDEKIKEVLKTLNRGTDVDSQVEGLTSSVSNITESVNNSMTAVLKDTSLNTECHNESSKKSKNRNYRDCGTQTLKKWAGRSWSTQTEKRSLMDEFEDSLRDNSKDCVFYTG